MNLILDEDADFRSKMYKALLEKDEGWNAVNLFVKLKNTETNTTFFYYKENLNFKILAADLTVIFNFETFKPNNRSSYEPYDEPDAEFLTAVCKLHLQLPLYLLEGLEDLVFEEAYKIFKLITYTLAYNREAIQTFIRLSRAYLDKFEYSEYSSHRGILEGLKNILFAAPGPNVKDTYLPYNLANHGSYHKGFLEFLAEGLKLEPHFVDLIASHRSGRFRGSYDLYTDNFTAVRRMYDLAPSKFDFVLGFNSFLTAAYYDSDYPHGDKQEHLSPRELALTYLDQGYTLLQASMFISTSRYKEKQAEKTITLADILSYT